MLALDADMRPTSSEILKHPFFTNDGFDGRFIKELRALIIRENEKNPLNHMSVSADDNKSKKKAKKEVPVASQVGRSIRHHVHQT